jgi:hypothetical protein
MGLLSRMMRRGEGGPPIREMRRDRIGDARMEADRRYRAESARVDDARELRRRQDDLHRRMDDDFRRREDDRRWRDSQR